MGHELLCDDFNTQRTVDKLTEKHAKEDPVDKIDGVERMSSTQAQEVIHKRIGAFECSDCHRIYYESIECPAAGNDGHVNTVNTKKICLGCQAHKTQSKRRKCNSRIDSDPCCNLAKCRCPDYHQCEHHHNQCHKVTIKCPGVDKCRLQNCTHQERVYHWL